VIVASVAYLYNLVKVDAVSIHPLKTSLSTVNSPIVSHLFWPEWWMIH